jgi:hypothetical protein
MFGTLDSSSQTWLQSINQFACDQDSGVHLYSGFLMVFFVLFFFSSLVDHSSEQRNLLLAPVILHVPFQSGSCYMAISVLMQIDGSPTIVCNCVWLGKKIDGSPTIVYGWEKERCNCVVNYLLGMPMGCAPGGVTKPRYNWAFPREEHLAIP